MDHLILSTIKRFRDNACWEGSDIPSWVLNECGLAIQGELGVKLTISKLSDRLTELQSRYHTFKEVVHTTGATWLPRQNFVMADDCVWVEILKNTFAAAYYHRDEPEFNLLASLFGLDDVKEEDAPTVIVISDSTIDAEKARQVVHELAQARLSNSLVQAVALLRQRNNQGVVNSLNDLLACDKAVPATPVSWEVPEELADLFLVYLKSDQAPEKVARVQYLLNISDSTAESLRAMKYKGSSNGSAEQEEFVF
ncbi:hypothetical protein SASPL_157981 [Salvia splendens]|uniref:Myb/SANT-like domain-containing protein n=1 Tax=Salvia splendens TaxID=180675 RepID=A0A8X8YVL9_SALSN|nr:hypothetical protein SASPL_157981 [Salvia splendens]